MDTMHTWALWRLLMIGLIALPFLGAAVVVSFRQSHADDSISGTGPYDKSAPPEISGPGAWGRDFDARVEVRSVDVPEAEQRAA